jgi:hypothetical protein
MELKEAEWEGMEWIHLVQDRIQRWDLVNKVMCVRFQVLTAASMKMAVFWDVAPRCLVEIY